MDPKNVGYPVPSVPKPVEFQTTKIGEPAAVVTTITTTVDENPAVRRQMDIPPRMDQISQTQYPIYTVDTEPSLMERTKEKASDLTESAKENLSHAAAVTKDKASELSEAAKDKASHAAAVTKEKASDFSESAKESLSHAAAVTKEKASEYSVAAKESLSHAATVTKEKASELSGAAMENLSHAATVTKESLSHAATATKEGLSHAATATKEGLSHAATVTKDYVSDLATAAKEKVHEWTTETEAPAVSAPTVTQVRVEQNIAQGKAVDYVAPRDLSATDANVVGVKVMEFGLPAGVKTQSGPVVKTEITTIKKDEFGRQI